MWGVVGSAHPSWSVLWSNPGDRLQVAADAQEWSDRLLNLLGCYPVS